MLSLDDNAVQMAAGKSTEQSLSVKDYLWSVFSDHADFLQKICEKTGKFELPVTEQILASPGSGAESWFDN